MRRLTIAWFAIAYVGLDANTILAARIANWFAKACTIIVDRLIAEVTGAFVWRVAISINAVSFAKRFAYIRRIVFGRTVAFVACTSFGCSTDAVYATSATNGFADIAA